MGVSAPDEDSMKIDSFSGKYRFLSNFYRCYIEYEGITYPSVEHAYQAAKTLSKNERSRIAAMSTPGEAKRAGRQVKLRADWEQVKVAIMLELLRKKFDPDALGAYAPNETKAAALLATGDAELIEGNTWGDRFWGVCGGVGENMLGKLLMQVREELRNVQSK